MGRERTDRDRTVSAADVEEGLCEQAVKLYRQRDRLINNDDQALLLSFVTGQANGLRIALCVLKGWDIDSDSDKEGKADNAFVEYWQERFPEDWS